MRTNIDIDDDLVAEAMRRSGLRTKKAVVDEALRTFVQLERQKDVLSLRGLWADAPEAAAEALREDDEDDPRGPAPER